MVYHHTDNWSYGQKGKAKLWTLRRQLEEKVKGQRKVTDSREEGPETQNKTEQHKLFRAFQILVLFGMTIPTAHATLFSSTTESEQKEIGEGRVSKESETANTKRTHTALCRLYFYTGYSSAAMHMSRTESRTLPQKQKPSHTIGHTALWHTLTRAEKRKRAY